MNKIFIIDDEPKIISTIQENLSNTNFQFYTYEQTEKALKDLNHIHPDIILLDLVLPGMNGFEFLDKVKDKDLHIIVISGQKRIESAVKAIKMGACDYITKPFDFNKLKKTINKYLTIKTINSDIYADNEIIGNSNKILQVHDYIKKLSRSHDTTIMIKGETGTGKELVARALHFQSLHKTKPFIEINCSAIQETLLESELFGHERGAFTGALNTKKGLLEMANGGTFFLDEIGDMPLGLQAKLLKVLEQKKIRRIGGLNEIDINVRFLCATSKNLEELTLQNKFRKDLYYRINVATINLPPLRDRDEDLLLLANHFLKHYCRKFRKSIRAISKEAKVCLKEYSWPGNVRELKNKIERAVLFEENNYLTCDSIFSDETNTNQMSPNNLSPGQFSLDEMERQLIVDTLTRTAGNQTKAAEILKVSRSKLKYRMKKYKIDHENTKIG